MNCAFKADIANKTGYRPKPPLGDQDDRTSRWQIS